MDSQYSMTILNCVISYFHRLQLGTEPIIQFEKDSYEVPAKSGTVEIPIKVEPKSTGRDNVGTKWKIPDNVGEIVNGPDNGTIEFKRGMVRYEIRVNGCTTFCY